MNLEQERKLGIILEGAKLNVKEDIAIEEMSELTKAIIKYRRNKGTLEDVSEEIADTMIMCEQLIRMYDIADSVNDWIDKKLDRQIRRDAEERSNSALRKMEESKKNIEEAELENRTKREEIKRKFGVDISAAPVSGSCKAINIASRYDEMSYNEVQRSLITDNID